MYDERGNKVYEENLSISRSYTYTDLNQVATVTDHVLNKTLTYAYGPNGNRSRMEGPSGEVTEYRYDALNRIRELVDPDGGRTVFAYSPAGRRDSLTFPNGVQGTYLWDQAGRLESIVYAKGAGDVLSSFTYTHDAAGNRLSKTFASGGVESYGYDDLHRAHQRHLPLRPVGDALPNRWRLGAGDLRRGRSAAVVAPGELALAVAGGRVRQACERTWAVWTLAEGLDYDLSRSKGRTRCTGS